MSTRLTQERQRQGLSKTQAAIKAGIHPSTWGRIEAGTWAAYPGWRRRISQALGVPEGELFGPDGRPLAPAGGANR